GAGSGFTSCLGWGLGATSVAGTGFGSSFGFGTSSDLGCSFGLGAGGGASAASTGLGLASGVGGLSVSTLLSPTFCASATISGRCVGVGAGVSRMVAFLSPSRICVIDSTGTISTGRASTSLTSNAEGARSVNKPRASAAACMITDVVSPTFNLLVLFLQGDEADIAEARRGDPGHDLHDGAIVGNLVAAHIDALVVTGLGDGLQLGHHLVKGNFRLLQIDPTFRVYGDGDRLRVRVHRLRLGVGQVDGHADGEQGRSHHEDDEQHQHDVDHRRHVYLRHQSVMTAAAPVAPTAAPRT